MTAHNVPAVGSEERKQYISELDAAHATDLGRKRMGIPRNTALDAAERITQIPVRFLKALDRNTRKGRKNDDKFTPTLDESKTLLACVTAFDRATAAAERLWRLLKEQREGYSEDEHRIALNRAVKMAASSWPAKDWWDALRIGWGDEVARVLVKLKWGEQALAELEGS